MSKAANFLKIMQKKKTVDMKDVLVDPAAQSKGFECISTGSLIVDNLIGGQTLANGDKVCPGFPRGRLIEIYGGEGSGKTTLALQAAVSCQRAGGTILYLDYENAISFPYAGALGLETSAESFMYANPSCWEDGAELISGAIDAAIDLIIVDSVAAMVPKATLEGKDISAQGRIGMLAGLNSAFLPKIMGPLKQSESVLLFINQIRSRIKTSMYDTGPDEDTSGGKAIKFFASLRMKLQPRAKEYMEIPDRLTGEKTKQVVSNLVRVEMVKNKMAPNQGHRTEVVIRYGQGFDNVRSVIDIAVRRKIIKKGGAWFAFESTDGQEQKCQGMERLREHFVTNQADFNHILAQVGNAVHDDAIELGDTTEATIHVESLDGSVTDMSEDFDED